MLDLDFKSLPVWGNLAILAIGGSVVWVAGLQLARLAESIALRTGMSRVLAGAMLLGVATSLPEIATTVTAGALGNAPLAVNNLFGGVAMQLAVLALIDFWSVRDGPLTFFSPDPVLLLAGVLLVLQVALAIIAVSAGDVAILAHIGFWPLLLVVIYGMSLYYIENFASLETWTAARLPEKVLQADAPGDDQKESTDASLAWLMALFAFNCVLVLIGGASVSTSADAFSAQTGIGSGFIGATLVAVATSLPEISTTAGAIRLGAYSMAIANILGTNTLEIALLFPADLAYRDGPVMNAVDNSALLMAGLSIVMTALYLWGLLERRDRSILRMGVDSWCVLLTYLAGLGVLYFQSGAAGQSGAPG
ncbi:sodium:calcium antiporter [Botrimarina mediterranea]|uniref:Putative calcium/sodium:proton antiporter n=1 Tax=Botrimarina mediterranea TaxID=2528022 RepID=A0A518KBY3_9BACT|nr:sodium:calcium antiporter [Botrimarina mediterranea]QDV75306.1 putative calcium/sodium:proton antiporter [Botrimarina mediterranea]QDV79975.1 putative calcium/sodium:proton antiporter [Planctomycetes bacterium K2D]